MPEKTLLIFVNGEAESYLPIEGFFRIISTPEGEAPLEVRKGWIGLVLPFSKIKTSPGRGVLSHNLVNGTAVITPTVVAIPALESHCPDAAKWWKNLGYPHSTEDEFNSFGFNLEEVELLSLEDARKIHPEQFEKLSIIMNTPPFSTSIIPGEDILKQTLSPN